MTHFKEKEKKTVTLLLILELTLSDVYFSLSYENVIMVKSGTIVSVNRRHFYILYSIAYIF